MTKRLATIGLMVMVLLLTVLMQFSGQHSEAQEPPLIKGPVRELFSPEVDGLSLLRQPGAFPYYSYNSGELFFPPYESDSERMGYNKSISFDTAPLKAGFYIDWGATSNAAHPNGEEYGRTIYFNVSTSRCVAATAKSQVTVNITGTALINAAKANPGAVWMVGNEGDSFYNGSPIHPNLYAELYHYFYTTLKAADPTAKIAPTSIVQPSPLRMEYLDRMLSRYQSLYGEAMPVDFWQIHLYRLNEGACNSSWGAAVPPAASSNQGWSVNFTTADVLNLAKMETALRDFRLWLRDRGYREIPLIISEYGVLPPPSYGFSDATAAQFLTDSMAMLLAITDPETGYPADGNRLVQAWSWYSTRDGGNGRADYGGDLFNADGTLSVIGEKFQGQTNAHYTPYIDFQPVPPLDITVADNSVMTVSGYMQNRGNIAANNVPVQIELIDPFWQQVVAANVVTIAQVSARYAANPIAITIPVAVSKPQSYTIVLAVDPHHTIYEVNRSNNVITYQTVISPDLTVALNAAEYVTVTPGQIISPTVIITVTNVGNWQSVSTPVKIDTIQSTEQVVVPVLQPGEQNVFTRPVVISQPGMYVVTATVNPANNPNLELDITNNVANAVIAAVDPADIHLSKSGPRRVLKGELITYTMIITNNNPVTLTNMVLTDSVPVGAMYIRGGTEVDGVVGWDIPVVSPGGGERLSLVVSANTPVINEKYGLQVSPAIHIAGTKSVITVVEGGTPALTLSKTGPEASIPGAPIAYLLTVVNNSPVPFSGGVITDAIPAGAGYITGGTQNGDVIHWDFPAIQPSGGIVTATFVVTAARTITNSDYRVSVAEDLSFAGNNSVVTVRGSVIPVDPAQGGTIVITDSYGLEVTQFLTVTIPVTAIDQPLVLSYARLPIPQSGLATSALRYTDLVFSLLAYQGSATLPLPGYSLGMPMTITVRYADTAVANEANLGLYYFDEVLGTWVPTADTCSSGSTQLPVQDTTRNLLSATACKLGKFALLQYQHLIYLPVILK